jgi:hypothetical protein
MTKITNIDTISALLDRLIAERIKHFFFRKEGQIEKANHQEILINAIKQRIDATFSEIFEKNGYDYINELRTFNERTISEELDELIVNDINIGESDRERLDQVKSTEPDIAVLIRNEKRLRKANEGRARNKNTIDRIIQLITRYKK